MRVGCAFDGGGELGLIIGAHVSLVFRPAFSELVGDAPPCHLQQPGLERTSSRVGVEVADFFANGTHRFLDDIFRLLGSEAGLAGNGVKQFSVNAVELRPTGLVAIRLGELADERPAGEQFIAWFG